MTPGRPTTFQTVEAGRGIAALLVVLFHTGGSIFPAAEYWNASPFGGIFNWGYAGVFFFFVLSGFIIMHAHAGDLGDVSRLQRYLSRRIVRIYPLYWLVLGGVVLLGWAGVGAATGTGTLLSSILLAGPDNRDTALAVAWTLYHEVLFYAVFAVWIANRRAGVIVTALWVLVIGTGLVAGPLVPAYVAAPVNLLFGYGALAWAFSRRSLPPVLIPLAAIGFVLVGLDVVWWHRLAEPLREQLFGLAAATGLAAVVARERRRPIAVPNSLLWLGKASYSIYLVHFLLLSLLAKLSVQAGLVGSVDPRLAFVAFVLLAVVGGIAVHMLVERPLLTAINARLPRRA